MKTTLNDTLNNSRFKLVLACAVLILSLLASNAQTGSQFWDNNGLSTPGDGTWDTSTPNWAPDTNLTATPGVFTNGNFAEFTAGTNPIPVLNINMADNTVVWA